VTYGRAFIAGILALVGALLPAAVGAQITIDGSLRPGTAGPLTGPNFVIGSGVGRTVGNNLFHSFGQFNVGGGESATFTGPASIGNVISRVTGGQLSSINGLIDTRTFMPSANFFLLNPAGVMLGPGASLNVGGAFHLSTADYLCLGAGGCLADPAAGKFFASLGRADVLTVAAPAAFGFFGPPTGSIVVDGSILPGIPDPPVGQTMSFVGGQIQVTGANLSPPGGRVQLVSVNSMGEVPIPSLEVRGFSALGSVTVSSSVIDVSGDRAGSVVIRGGNLLIDATSIAAGTTGVNGTPVGIEMSASGSLIINSSALISSTSGDGRGGDIRLSGTNLELTNGSVALSIRAGAGAGGDVSLTADTLTLSGGGTVLSQNFAEGPARNGNVSATATGAMLLTEGSTLQSTADVGDGGQVSVSAGSLTMEIGASIASSAATGRGGDVVVTAPQLTLRSGAQISSSISDSGRGGDVRVISTGTATIADPLTGIGTSSSGLGSPGLGLPGDISAHFGSLTLTGEATIQSGVLGGTQGGNISLVATGPVIISNRAGIGSAASFNDVGNITISAPQIVVSDGSISTSTLQSGRAGDISITAGTLALENGGQISSGSIAASTGRGGDVHLNLDGSLTISGQSPPSVQCPTGCSALRTLLGTDTAFTDPRSGIFSTAAGTAPGGNITIRSPQIQLRDGGTISAASTGTAEATAGNIDITFGALFSLNRATITTDSTLADGGNITITSTGSLLHLVNSQITTSVQSGVGGGGNITLGSTGHPLDFIVLDNSGIHADAFGGPGGNINIFANVMFSSTPIETAVTASSALSAPGTVSINAVITDVSGSLAELSTEVLGVAALLRASCAARLAEGKTSSLVVAGREGLPLEPGGLLPSALRELHAAGVAGSAAPFFASEWPGLRLSYLDAACGR
jgi:filamentous hemagglutinin family protein